MLKLIRQIIGEINFKDDLAVLRPLGPLIQYGALVVVNRCQQRLETLGSSLGQKLPGEEMATYPVF